MNLAQLTWQCRRGTQELDRLLFTYLQAAYADAPCAEQQQFAQLLALPDAQLLHWFFLAPPAQHDFAKLIAKIQHLSAVSPASLAATAVAGVDGA